MSRKVQLLYDFQAETEGELTAREGDILTLIDSESYDGWYMVSNDYGAQGIVPSTYVNFLSTPTPPQIPIPPQPTSPLPAYNMPMPSYANIPAYQPTQQDSFQPYKPPGNNFNNDFDDFDDDDDDEPPARNPPSYTDANNSTLQRNSFSNPSNTLSQNTATIKHKPKNIFGLDAFLIHGPLKQVNESEKVASITIDNQGLAQWVRKSPPYRISIPNVSSGKKYHGLKEYTTYSLETQGFGHPVSRRYKQFDWLHERLLDKYPNICVPPLPDKVVTGRFEEEFIKKRQTQLESWLNRMSLHPVVSSSEIFIYFLQCKDGDTAKWKDFKRKQEKHEYRGAQWLCTINVPLVSPGTTANVKERVEKFSKATNILDSNIKNLMQGVDKLASTHTNVYKKELGYVGKKFEELGNCMCSEALNTVNTASNNKLSEALIHTGLTYNDIANMYSEQAKTDAYPMLDQLTFYRGLLQQMPEVVAFEKNAIQIVEDWQQKPDISNLGDIMARLDVVNYATLSEMNYFNGQKINDFNFLMRRYLTKQIEFYSEITEKLQKALTKFEVPPPDNFNQ